MRLYNTLTRRTEDFAPLRDDTVRMYACGLTVYARGHIGNFRTFVCLDVLRRALRHVGGHRMRQVVNFTDVDDKTIAGARKAGVPLRDYTDRYIAAYREDAAALGIEPAEASPRATDEANLRAMAATVEALEARGHAYRSDGSVYFKILDAAGLRQAGAARSCRHAGRGAGRQRRVRQGDGARLRALEGDRPRRADLGLRHRSGPAGLAHRVLGDGVAAARRTAHRHPRRRGRPDLPAPRERDRPVRGRDGAAVRPLLGPRRAPAARRRREDVEIARQRRHRAGHPRPGVPARPRSATCCSRRTTASNSDLHGTAWRRPRRRCGA